VWRSPKVAVRESAIGGGLAVFADTDIAKDEVVAVKAGHVVYKRRFRAPHNPAGRVVHCIGNGRLQRERSAAR
ncbi:MAG: hypothetical protein AAF862_10160, partial [Pseudomonadota bacterium]